MATSVQLFSWTSLLGIQSYLDVSPSLPYRTSAIAFDCVDFVEPTGHDCREQQNRNIRRNLHKEKRYDWIQTTIGLTHPRHMAGSINDEKGKTKWTIVRIDEYFTFSYG